MDALGDILEPYSEIFAKIAGTVTCMQFLSGVFLLNDIRKRQQSDTYPIEPFLGGIVLSVLSAQLGVAMGDINMINVNLFGIFINVLFALIFYYYASKDFRQVIHKKTSYAALFILIASAYGSIEDPKKLEFRLGMVITGILLMLVGGPLLNLPKIIEKKSTEGMPFPIILAGNLVASSWMLYAVSIKNSTLIYQNLLMMVLGGIQLSLFAIYPNTPTEQKKESSKKKKNQ